MKDVNLFRLDNIVLRGFLYENMFFFLNKIELREAHLTSKWTLSRKFYFFFFLLQTINS